MINCGFLRRRCRCGWQTLIFSYHWQVLFLNSRASIGKFNRSSVRWNCILRGRLLVENKNWYSSPSQQLNFFTNANPLRFHWHYWVVLSLLTTPEVTWTRARAGLASSVFYLGNWGASDSEFLLYLELEKVIFTLRTYLWSYSFDNVFSAVDVTSSSPPEGEPATYPVTIYVMVDNIGLQVLHLSD